MDRARKWFAGLLVLAAAATLGACNLATIDAPLNGQIHPSEPVDFFVILEPGADHTTFQAFLNGSNISSLFKYDADLKVMKAKVSSADGLVVGTNRCSTQVRGVAQGIPLTDADSASFIVQEGGVATNRDDKGVWFITGPEDASLYEVCEAMGYAVATDRLWQLEQLRRSGRGRLSEILGPSMVTTDIYLRTTGYSNDEIQAFFDALDPEYQAMVQGYVDGINRRITDLLWNPDHIPLEFTLIDLNKGLAGDSSPTLTLWTIQDLLGWLSLFMKNFDGNALDQTEIKNASLLGQLQANFPSYPPELVFAMFNDLRWTNDPDALTYIPGGGGPMLAPLAASVRTAAVQPLAQGATPTFPDLRQVADRMAAMNATVEESLKSINAYVKMGSYGWVVAGSKTASGNPILYSGPQMGFDTPSIVLEGSIQAGGWNISGMTIPGAPGLLISRTPHHAVAFMTGHANSEDYYIEDPADVFLHRVETIKVLGGADMVLPIYRSVHGPILNPLPFDPDTYVPSPNNPIISWKYSHWGYEYRTLTWLLNHPRASSVEEYGDAVEYIAASFHVLYADVDGNIAYWMAGRDPYRPPVTDWRFPQGFLGPPVEWGDGLLPRSTDRNPEQGFYCGWNNKSSLTYDGPYGPFHRAQVVYDYLYAHNNLTFYDVRNIAINIATTDSFGGGGNPWPFVDDYFSAVVSANPTPERLNALSILASWDGHFVDGGPSEWAFGTNRSDGWVLMDTWLREVIRLTFEDELGSGESRDNLFNVILHSLPGSSISNNYNWFQNLSNPGAPQTLDAIILAALDSTLDTLGPQPWGINARGEITFNHPVLASIGSGVVHVIPRSSRSTYGQCIEYGSTGPVRIESMFPLGESGMVPGNPLSYRLHPHFLSMTPVYDGFVHRAFPLFD